MNRQPINQQFIVTSTAAVLLLLSAVLFTTLSDPPEGEYSGRTESGDPEMSEGRVAWELERLRDPATGEIPANIRHHELQFAATLPSRNSSSPLLKSARIARYDWNRRGPWNVGGRTRSLGIDIRNEQNLLAGGVSGGMWRSTNGGLDWQLVTRPDQIPSVTTIAQDRRPGKEDTWYFGTGELYGNSASGGAAFWNGDGIYKSTDNGVSWFPLLSTVSGTPQVVNLYDNIWRIAVDPSKSDQDVLYAAIRGGVMRSTDGGATWTNVLIPKRTLDPICYFSDVAVTDEGIVYATASSDGAVRGIYRSEDGLNFTNISPADLPASYNRIVIGLVPSNPNALYFFGETPGTGFLGKNFRGDSSWQSLWHYTYVSGNGAGDGGVWENRSANLPGFGGSNGDLFTQGGYDLHVSVKPDNENVVFIGGTNLYRSTTGFSTSDATAWVGGFQTWQRDSTVIENYSYPGHHADQHDIIFSYNDPDRLYTVSDGGVHMTFDCTGDSISWVSLNNGYLTTQFYTVAIDHATDGSRLVIGGLQDNGTWRTATEDVHRPWILTGTSDGAYCAISNGSDHLYVSKQLGKIYRVELDGQGNAGGSTRIDPVVDSGTEYRFINPFILDPNDSRVMYLPIATSLWRNSDVTAIPTDNNAATPDGWTKIEGSAVGNGGGVITALAATTSAPADRVWYGTSTARLFRMDDARGENPSIEQLTVPFPSGAYISSIAVDSRDGDRAIVVLSNYNVISLYQTTDGGKTWTAISGNLEQNPNGSGTGPSVRWASIIHRGSGTLYLAATSTGLYSTTSLNGMQTVWEQEGYETIGNVVVDMIDARESDGYVVIGTHGNGIYSTTIGLLGVDDQKNREGSDLALEPVRPNPLGETGEISFMIPSVPATGTSNDHVRLSLFNTEGTEIALLMDADVRAGRHTIPFDRRLPNGERLPSGTYFLLLRYGNETRSQGMIVGP